jgi:uncharacterized protein YjbI with pentapeptide repeats
MRSTGLNMLKKLSVVALALVAPSMTALPALARCSDAPAPGVDWQDCRKGNLILEHDNLERANLAGTDLSSTDLSWANLSRANLTKAQLMRSKLKGVSAPRAIFTKVFGSRTDFSGANLEEADFERAELSRSDFTNSNLAFVDFNRSDIGRSDFSDATLIDPDFSFANLARADLRTAKISGKVNVKGAFLLNTRLEGVDLTGFTGLAQWQVNMVCGDDGTKLSDWLRRPDNWTCSDED